MIGGLLPFVYNDLEHSTHGTKRKKENLQISYYFINAILNDVTLRLYTNSTMLIIYFFIRRY